MKRLLAVLAAASVVSAAVVAAASGGEKAVPTPRQFAALQKQVAGLSKKVNAQGRKIKALRAANTYLMDQVTTLDGTVNTQASSITTLQGNVTTMQGKLSALQTDEGQVKAVATDADAFINQCLTSVVGIDQLGSSFNPNEGYVYQPLIGGTILTTALDIDTGIFPGWWVQTVQPTCVDTSASSHASGRLTEHRSAAVARKQR